MGPGAGERGRCNRLLRRPARLDRGEHLGAQEQGELCAGLAARLRGGPSFAERFRGCLPAGIAGAVGAASAGLVAGVCALGCPPRRVVHAGTLTPTLALALALTLTLTSGAYLAAPCMQDDGDGTRRRPTCAAHAYSAYGGEEDVISVTGLDRGGRGGAGHRGSLERPGHRGSLERPGHRGSLEGHDPLAELSRIGEDGEAELSQAELPRIAEDSGASVSLHD